MIRMILVLTISILNLSFLVHQEKPKKVIFFGDSITELGVKDKGYISVLSEYLKTKNLNQNFELIGSGIGGNKVYDLFFRLEKDILAHYPDIVVLWIGVNDVWHKSSFGTGTDIDKFESMYVGIIERLHSKGIKVYCCTPACIGEKTDHSNSQDGDLNEYSKIIRKVAENQKAGLIDFRKAFLTYNHRHNHQNQSKGILTYDGVHLNDKGNELVANLMFQSVIEGRN